MVIAAQQIKSKQRVADHGEVFTSEREVNAMLDLVKQETERIESRFLEPACGTGNFLIEVLRRKLDVVENRYKKSQLEYERYAVLAISSIYGVDILEDNVIQCRQRLFDYFNERYTHLYGTAANDDCRTSVKFILEKNILWGDALTMKTVCGKQDPIVFSEWSAVNGSMIKRRDYPKEKGKQEKPIPLVELKEKKVAATSAIPAKKPSELKKAAAENSEQPSTFSYFRDKDTITLNN